MTIFVHNNRRLLILSILVLMFAAWLRVSHLVDFIEWPDEIWSVWHVRGTFQEAMSRVPYDWPPLFSAVTWLWQHIAGDRLEVARYLMALIGTLGAAVSYQAAASLSQFAQRKSQKYAVGMLSMLTWGGTAYTIFAGVDVRAYGLLLTLGMLAFWLTIRWLKKPSWQRGLIIGFVLTAMFYSSYTSLAFIVLLTAFVIILRPHYFVRWLIVLGALIALSIPVVAGILSVARGRFSVMEQTIPPFGEAIRQILKGFSGSDLFLIPLVVAIALVIGVFIRMPQQRRLILIMALWIGSPIGVYIITRNHEFWTPRYMWWALVGLVIFIGYGLSFLPRKAYAGAALILIALPLLPVDWSNYRLSIVTSPSYRQTLSWMAEHIRPGDVVVIDPKCTCGDPAGWDYFMPQYFPTGYLPIVDHPGDAPRVWYLSTDGFARDEQLLAEVEKGRKASIFVGPWNFLWRLYEGPPSWTGVTFGEAVTLNGVEIENNLQVMPEDKTFQLKLWWSAAKKLDLDYSIGIVVLDRNNHVVAQVDGAPTAPDTPEQTSTWQPGNYYEDYRMLSLPSGLEGGTYTLLVGVYQWWDNVHLKPEQNSLFPDITDFDYLVVKKFQVMSY